MNKLRILVRAGALVCVIAGAILLVGRWLSGCACGTAGCGNGATLTIELAEGMSIPEGSTVTACLNDTCADSVLAAATASGAGFGRYAMFPVDACVLGFVSAPDGPGGIHVEISWFLDCGGLNLQAGDRYSVTLADPAGATIATKQATATSYVTHKLSNGPGCANDCPMAQFPQ